MVPKQCFKQSNAASSGGNDIPGYPEISRDIPGYPGTSRDIPGYPGISWDILGYPGISLDIPGYPGTSRDILGYPGISRNDLRFLVSDATLAVVPYVSDTIPLHPLVVTLFIDVTRISARIQWNHSWTSKISKLQIQNQNIP